MRRKWQTEAMYATHPLYRTFDKTYQSVYWHGKDHSSRAQKKAEDAFREAVQDLTAAAKTLSLKSDIRDDTALLYDKLLEIAAMHTTARAIAAKRKEQSNA
jgi:transcription initiation factor TFIIIB Brf1 subunit/transcription initiation factor TFIIB